MPFGLEGQLSDLVRRRDELSYATQQSLQAGQLAGRQNLLPQEQRAIDDVSLLNDKIAEISGEVERAGGDTVRALQARIDSRNQTRTLPGSPMNPIPDHHLTYRKNILPGGPSYIRDLMRTQLGMDDTGESRQRLASHARDVAEDAAFVEFRDLSRVDGNAGYFVPPAWLINQYVALARPGRAFADLCQQQPLPGGTDSVNVPRVLTGTTVGIQTADNTQISETDLTDTFINAPVRTIAGQQGVAIQLIDQSPIDFTEVIFRDLVAAHATQVDIQCLDGTGTSGQVLGVDYTAGIQTINVSALTVQGIYSVIANAVQLIHTHRFLPPEYIVMHPRRWAFLLAQLDTTGRPLFIPNANGPMNVAGLETAVASQQIVGQVQGISVVTDPNVSVTNGPYSPSGNEDVIYVLRSSDIVLYETGVRARVLPETRANNLTILCQLYSYLAFTAARYPASIVAITGLSAPSF
jgi:HK97 family phage major capsid protein